MLNRYSLVTVLCVCFAASILIGFVPTTVDAGGTIALLGQLDLAAGSQENSDITSYYDPNTQKEYAIVGEWRGSNAYIVDVTIPSTPVLVKTITLTHAGNGFDLKTWNNYLYLVDGNGTSNDGEIWDISDPANPTFAGNFLSAHNIFIADDGYMYNEISGLSILDLASNPTNPGPPIWNTLDSDGHDATAIGNILYDFHGYSGTNIYDITNRSNPVLLGSMLDPNDGLIRYHHSGWPSADGNHVFLCDELAYQNTPDSPDINVYDISNPMNFQLVDSYSDPAPVHNAFRVGNFLHVSYYTSGYKVFDVSDPTNIQLCDEYDTSAFSGLAFSGAWGCDPFLPSGNIIVSDTDNGLYVFSFTPTPTAIGDETPTSPFTLNQNFPNPFNPTTTITYDLSEMSDVDLAIYNTSGQKIRTLVDKSQLANFYSATWDGRNDDGRTVASGVYFYKLPASGRTETKRMVLLK
jgi:hypothetical protein